MTEKNKTAGRFAHAPTAQKIQQPHYHRSGHPRQEQFNKSLLPAPIVVLKMLGIKPKKPANAAGYWPLVCPFHKNGKERHPSLNLHYINGNYRCHTCGEKGGDILAFYRAFTGKNFIESAQDLGAWEEKK